MLHSSNAIKFLGMAIQRACWFIPRCMQSSNENSICPSVCLSIKRVHHDKTEERSVQIFIPYEIYEISFSLVFWEEKRLVGANHSTTNLGSTGPRWSEIANFELTFARSASAVTPSKKSSINTNRKSTMRFPVSLRWSSNVAPKLSKEGLKNAKRSVLLVFTALHEMMTMRILSVCLYVKSEHCDKTEERSVQIFIPYEISRSLVFWEEKWLVGATPSTWNLGSSSPVGVKSPILNRYSLVAPQP